MNKKCTKCKQEFPATDEYFYRDKYQKSGIRAKCKECCQIEKKEYYHKNIDLYRESNRRRQKKYKANITPEKKKELQRLKVLHMWISRHKDKQQHCSICNEIKKVELSNISGEYKRDISDYWWLCIECHRLFDKINKTHKTVIISG